MSWQIWAKVPDHDIFLSLNSLVKTCKFPLNTLPIWYTVRYTLYTIHYTVHCHILNCTLHTRHHVLECEVKRVLGCAADERPRCHNVCSDPSKLHMTALHSTLNGHSALSGLWEISEKITNIAAEILQKHEGRKLGRFVATSGSSREHTAIGPCFMNMFPITFHETVQNWIQINTLYTFQLFVPRIEDKPVGHQL